MSRMVGRSRRSTPTVTFNLGGRPDAVVVGGGSEQPALPSSLWTPWEITRSPRCFPFPPDDRKGTKWWYHSTLSQAARQSRSRFRQGGFGGCAACTYCP